MGRLQFKNQDDEWESFPTDEEIARSKEVQAILEEFTFMTRCCLCNKEFDVSEIVITGGSLRAGFTWSCPECHAVTLETNVPKS